MPPVKPMLSKAAKALPPDDGWLFEPKWDGFRCIAFRDGDTVELGSRNERPLTRYFPEVVEALKASLPDRVVVDGELVIAIGDCLDFDSLQLRLHPAESRVRKLAAEIPASFVAFDLLAFGDRDLRAEPLSVRRAVLETALSQAEPPVHLTPATTDRAVAHDWFQRFEGAGLDGVIAKRLDSPYRENERTMIKVKHERTADCAVVGFRWHKSGGIIGSLLLGLFDDKGVLHHVGVTASFTMARRAELVAELEPYVDQEAKAAMEESYDPAAFEGRHPGGSRWSAGKDLSFTPLRLELVCEVAYDHLQGDRFRHGTTFRRWRPDRDPESCRYDQLEVTPPALLADLFGGG
jgi:ATP-dependent DNA ligase